MQQRRPTAFQREADAQVSRAPGLVQHRQRDGGGKRGSGGGKGRLHERLRGTHGEESGWGFGEKDASCWRNSTPAAPGGDATLSPAHGPIGGQHTPPLVCPAPISRTEVVEAETARPLRFALKETGTEGSPLVSCSPWRA